jgi:hypothetical protein
MAGGRWPFSRKGKNDHEAYGSRRRRSPQPPPPRTTPTRPRQVRRSTTPHRAQQPPWDRVYVRVRMARWLYARGEPMPWPDVNLPGRWHLKIRRVPVLPVPRDGSERVQEIRRWRALLPLTLRRGPVFAIESPAWDTFARW